MTNEQVKNKQRPIHLYNSTKASIRSLVGVSLMESMFGLLLGTQWWMNLLDVWMQVWVMEYVPRVNEMNARIKMAKCQCNNERSYLDNANGWC